MIATDTLRLAARTGARTWLAYAAVELFFMALAPRVLWPAHLYRPASALATLVGMATYPTVGALLALFLYPAMRRVSDVRDPGRVQAASSLLLLITANASYFVLAPPQWSVRLAILISSPVALVAALSILSPAWLRRSAGLTNPWTVSLIIVGVPWLMADGLAFRPDVVRAAGATAFAALVASSSLVVARLAGAGRVGRFRAWGRHHALAWPLMLSSALVLISLLLHQAPLAASRPARQADAAGRPNVVIVIMDAVRADHLSLYGYRRRTSPHLEEFAKGAVVYRNALAPANQTLSSHGSLFTGLYPSWHGAVEPRRPLGQAHRTLAEILADAGYLTLAVVANPGYLRSTLGLAQGFRYWDERVHVAPLASTRVYYLRQALVRIVARLADAPLLQREFRSAPEITTEVLAQIDAAARDSRPFFLFVNYMDAHSPHQVIPASSGAEGHRASPGTLRRIIEREKRHPPRAELDELITRYDRAIAVIDLEISKIVDRLKQLGHYENSVIVISSDHGEALGDRFRLGHGRSLYQDEIHVPLLVKYPHVSVPVAVDKVVSLLDLFPTILEVSGMPPPGRTQGKSLLTRDWSAPYEVLAESFHVTSRGLAIQRAIVSGSLKLLVRQNAARELYDLRADPDERGNLFGRQRVDSEALELKLARWTSTIGASLPGAIAIDPETEERLRSLGYLR